MFLSVNIGKEGDKETEVLNIDIKHQEIIITFNK